MTTRTARDHLGRWSGRTPEPGTGPEVWNVTGGRISPDELHSLVVSVALEHGWQVGPETLRLVGTVDARLDHSMAGPSPIFGRLDGDTSAWLDDAAHEAVDWLNANAAPTGRQFRLTDALYLDAA